MRVTLNIVILLTVLLGYGFADNSNIPDSILYANAAGLDLMSDAPWLINKDDYIPFSFIIKDCNQYLGLEFHCLAIYDISDGIKYYGDEIVPDVDYTFRTTEDSIIFEIAYPPLKPNPLDRTEVPNQIFYYDYTDMGYSSPPNFIYNWWKKEVNKFKCIGTNWNQSLNGQLTTPSALGYNPGDTITFRTIIVCRKIFYDPNMMQWSLLLHFRERDLRIVVVADQCPMPKLSNWYLADCHTHSWNTDDEFEYGGVTPFMAKAAKKIGLDCVIFTDHSNDCGWVQDHNDGWGSGTNWNHCGWEINQYQNVLLIRGEEISAMKIRGGGKWVPYPPFYFPPRHNTDNERHFLGFGISDYVRGWHPLVLGYPGLKYDVNEVISGGPPPGYGSNPSNNIRAQSGFVYYAHPGDYYQDFGDSATIDSALLHTVFRGLQIFNCRKTHKSGSGLEWHPWGEFPYGQTWQEAYVDWFEIYVPIMRIWDRYMSQHLNNFRKKVLVLGGSDAHGDFNYAIAKTPTVGADWYAEATALGAWRTAVYCPGGLTRDNILNGLKNGRTVVTDGPVMIFGIDMNNDGGIYDAVDMMIGDGDNNEDGVIDHKARLFGACKDSGTTTVNPTSYINFMFEWQSNNLFGPVDSIVLYQGTSTTGDHPDQLCKLIPSNGQQGTMNYKYYWILEAEDSVNSYFRAIAYSQSGSGVGQQYRCFTNPIWIRGYFETPPNNLHITWYDESQVRIAWEWHYACIPDCWKILRREYSPTWPYEWDTVATVYWGYREYEDNTVERGKKYVYRIVAAKGTTRSKHSNSAVVQVPLLNRPWRYLRVHSPASDRIVVEFRDLSNFETRFDVERKCPATGESWHVEKTLPAEPQSGNWVVWDDYNVKPESTYFYRVMAYTSIEPAGYSAYTWKYGVTVWPHLKTGNNDSATAYQPKVIYTPEDNLYYMTYAGENLLFASKSNNGIDWEGMNAVCYSGYPWIVNWDAGFSQVDINEDGVPVVVFSIKGNSGSKDKKHWWSGINMGYFVADSNQWLDSITLYEYMTYQEEPLLFFPFAFKVVGDTVHLVYFVDNILKYRWYDFATPETGNPIDIGTVATGLFNMNDCYPVIDRDQDGNLYVAWFFGEYGISSGLLMHYRERINGVWLATEEFEIPWRDTWPGIDQGVRYLSIRRSNNKTYVLCTIAGSIQYPGITWLEEHSLALSAYEGSNWQTEWVFPDTTVSNGQLLTENLILYALEVNNNFDIYYQEKIGTGWSDPICIKNTVEKSKFPQGVFDGENIALIWTEGDAAPYVIDTAKVRVILHVEIVFPAVENIPGSRLRAGLPLEINWTSSDNVGVDLHRVYYSLDYGATYTQIGGDLSGTTYELSWTVPDTIVSGLMLKVEAYDGAGMLSAQEEGSFITTKEFVFNPNFEDVSEDKPYLWTSYGTGDVFEADWEYVQNGQFSAHISRGSADGYFGFYQKQIPVEPNTKYWLQGYIKTQSTAGTANLAFGMWHSDPDTNHHRDFGDIAGNTDWTYVCDSLTTRPYEDTIQVMMFGNPAFIGDARFDNLTLLIDTVAPHIIVSYPNGGESLLVEEQIHIYWYATDNVKMGKIDSILYSIDAGQNWNTIAVDLPETINSYEWTVPAFSDQYKIRVVASDASGNRSRDESDDCFGTTYFARSGFEYTDPDCFENELIGAQGVVDAGAIRVAGSTNGVEPHTGQFMYKIYGTDNEATQNSYVIYKVFPYDFPIHDSTYFSFWLYIEEAPTDSGHICMDAYTKSGNILRAWSRFGKIIDQTGQRIHPALHSAPKHQWYQYVFSFAPAVAETVDYIELIYDDYNHSETGYFEGYMDDIEVSDSFPILDMWHAEKFPVGSPPLDPTYWDPNFEMNFIAEFSNGVELIINPQGDGGEGAHWVAPIPGLRNDVTDIPINQNTMFFWEQYDKAHSLILSLLIHDSFDEDHWLIYAKNADNHWYKEGWVNMGDPTQHYEVWEWFYRNIRDDYIEEYGEGMPPNGVEPLFIKEMRLEHFAKSEWIGDHGGTIKNLFIGEDTIAPVVEVIQPNGGERCEIRSIYPIIWEARDNLQIGLQSIYYSTDAGESWQNVIENQQFEPTASYQYDWQIPDHASENCLIRVLSNDIANNTGSDESNNPFSICWLTSIDSIATTGNGERVVYDQDTLHITFTSADSIFYSYSSDQGETWRLKEFIDFGKYPAIAIDDNHALHLIYKKNNTLRHKEINGSPGGVTIYTTNHDLQLHSFTIVGDKCFLAFEEREYQGMDPISHLIYGYLDLGVPPNGNLITREIMADNTEFLKNPHIAIFQSDEPHIAYERADSIYYVYQLLDGEFSAPFKLGPGKSPYISINNEIIDVVWESQNDIYHQRKWYYSSFGEAENISQTPMTRSKEPVIISPYLVIWFEGPGDMPNSRYDIVYSIWQRDNWSEQVTIAINTQLVHGLKTCFDGDKIYCTYTCGNSGPYAIKNAKMSVGMILPHRTSKTKLATASNNAKRIVLDNTEMLHVFYRSGDYLFYTYDNTDRIFAEGRYPAVFYEQDSIHTIWISGSLYPPHNIWYRQGIAETWDEPMVVWSSPGSPNYRILPPSFTASNDSGYIVIEEEHTVGSTLYWKLYFITFPLADPCNTSMMIIDSAQISPPPSPPPQEEPISPSITLDDDNNPHIVWSDKNGHLWYTYRQYGTFMQKQDLTEGYIGTINAKRPCIEKYRNRLSVVFELFNDIYYAYRILTPAPNPLFDWSELKNLSNSADSSCAPIILCGSQVFYSEKVSDNWEIFNTKFDGFEWSLPENISNTAPASSHYVQGIAQINLGNKEGSKEIETLIYLVWTDGYEDEYHLEYLQLMGSVPNWQSGEITENTTWDGNVFVTGDITVKENVNLTIMPGTNIYFSYPDDQHSGKDYNRCELIIRGYLNAIGTPQDSIQFIAYPGNESPYGKHWYGLGIFDYGNAAISYARIRNSNYAVFLNYNATGNIENTRIDSNSYGITISNNSTAAIRNSEIMFNSSMGIYCSGSRAIIDSNYIYKNSLAQDTLRWTSRGKISTDSRKGLQKPDTHMDFMIPVPMSHTLDHDYGNREDTLPFSCTGIVVMNSEVDIANNTIVDNFKGLYTSGWIVGTVKNNLFDSNRFHGFDFVGDSLDIVICGNTFTNNGWYPWPIVELAGIYQGVFEYHSGTRIEIINNKFYDNNVGIYFAKYYQAVSSPTQVYVTNNEIKNNRLGIGTRNDRDANLEAILTHNTIVDNQDYQVLHDFSHSLVLNLGDLDNESALDDGNNKIYSTFGVSQYALVNKTPYELKAQGNYWASRDSATIDTLLIYDDDEDPNSGLVNFDYFATWGEIEPGTVWQGIVNLGGDVVIPEDVTLTIEPETEIRFAAGIDGAQGGIDTARTEMIVFGEIEVGEQKNGEKRRPGETEIGRPNECQMTNDDLYGAKAPTPELSDYRTMESSNHKIYFTSDAFEPEPGDWYGIRIPGNQNIRGSGKDGIEREIKDWVIEYAECGLYFGDEEIEVKSCSLIDNYIGVKIEAEAFEVKESWFIDNRIAMIFEAGSGEIKNNLIVGNDTGMVISGIAGEIKENMIENNGIGIYLTEADRISGDSGIRGKDISISEYQNKNNRSDITRDVMTAQMQSIHNGHKIRGWEASPTIGRENVFDHNFGYHIYNDTPDSIDATENYWYPAEPESIALYIYDYYDDPDLGVVWFEPTAGGFAGGPQGYGDAQLEKIKVSFGSNPTTHFAINYSLPSTQNVNISVYDVTGRLVSREDEKKEKGIYNLAINNLPSGVYFVKFKASDFVIERKIILLK